MLEDVYLQGNLPAEHIYASPILDDFHDLPATLLAFGEHDFLAFEDFAYARHAAKAGVNLKTIIYRGLGNPVAVSGSGHTYSHFGGSSVCMRNFCGYSGCALPHRHRYRAVRWFFCIDNCEAYCIPKVRCGTIQRRILQKYIVITISSPLQI